jgi:type VI secretion system protein ImpH
MAMADSIWGTGRRLDDCLFHQPHEFEFYQAARLLNLMSSERLGHDRATDGAIRFTVHPSLLFPPSPVVDITEQGEDEPIRMSVAFLGLIGAAGVLPLPYTEAALHQRMTGESSYAAFFDIFHHRLLSLFYRAWEKHHLYVGLERSIKFNPEQDALTTYLYSLVGMGTGGLRGRLPFEDAVLLRCAGLLAQRPRSAECLRALLKEFLGAPVQVDQFIGRWEPLDGEDQCRIGDEVFSNQLGEGSVAGDMVWTRQSAVRVVIGPVDTRRFIHFMPGSSQLAETSALIRWYLGPTIEFAIQPVIAEGEVPEWSYLGEVSGPMLGWCSWLRQDAFPSPATEAVFAESECSLARGHAC